MVSDLKSDLIMTMPQNEVPFLTDRQSSCMIKCHNNIGRTGMTGLTTHVRWSILPQEDDLRKEH